MSFPFQTKENNRLLISLINSFHLINVKPLSNPARIITCCSRSSEAIEQLHWPTLSSRRSYHKAKLVFLCLHSLVPSYFSLYFTRFSNIHNYSTRQSMRLSLPNVKQNFGKRTFLFTGAKIFNKLPLNIVKSENIQTFCRQARHFFLS